jgi:uncharacterized membrane protein YbhN (UPF0104 family)
MKFFLKVSKFKLSNKVTFFLSLVFLATAIYYLSIEINTSINSFVQVSAKISFSSLIIAVISVFLLQFLNWFFEALKFKILFQNFQSISIISILKSIYVGNFTAFFTPERLGNFIGRSMVLKQNKKEVIATTLIGNMGQLIITVVIGLFSMLILRSYLFSNLFHFDYFQIVPFLLYFLFLVALLFLYFNTKSIHVFSKFRFIKKWIGDIKSINNIKFSIKLCALGFALLRYLVFYFQYLILAKAIHLEVDYLSLFTYVGVLFGVVTFIPSPLPGNLGTREGVASFLLGGGIFGIKFSLISFIVWLINVGFSTIFGGIVYSYSYLRK